MPWRALGIILKKVPTVPKVLELAALRMVPAGSYANRNFCARSVREVGAVDRLYLDIIANAQTSGGLLLAVPAAEATGGRCAPGGRRRRCGDYWRGFRLK